MLRFLMVLVVIAFAAWWLDLVPGRGAEGVDTGAARQRGAEVGERVADGVNRAARAAEDATLTTKIKSKMALDDVVRAQAIDVDTIHGVVTLTGMVSSDVEHQRALQLARETVGVREVIDRLRRRR